MDSNTAKEIGVALLAIIVFIVLVFQFSSAADPCHASNIHEDCAPTQDPTSCIQERKEVCR